MQRDLLRKSGSPPDHETPEQAAARRAMPPYEPEPAAQDNPPLSASPDETRARFTWLGICLVALGVLALVFPFVSTLATTLFVGGLFLAAGVVKLFSAFASRAHLGQSLLKALWGLVYLAGGALILYAPLPGAWSLTLVLASLFVVGGGASIAWALAEPKPRGWSWMAASGALSIVLGLLVAIALPSAAFWFPGVVAGVDLVSTGLAFLAMDRAARVALSQAGLAN
jgi:uncharacterized membrane protein HdeD (DUF308 family)